MSAGFRAVQWNRAKLVYDGVLLAGVTLYIGTYILLSFWHDPPKDEPAAIDVRIRAASHGQARKSKLNAVCSSSGRRYRANRSTSGSQISPTRIRSGPYPSAMDRQLR